MFPKTKNFRAGESKPGRFIEIDGLAKADGFLLVMECKHRNCKLTKTILEHLKENTSIFPEDLKRLYCIFSRSGFEDGIKNEKPYLGLFDMETVFGDIKNIDCI